MRLTLCSYAMALQGDSRLKMNTTPIAPLMDTNTLLLIVLIVLVLGCLIMAILLLRRKDAGGAIHEKLIQMAQELNRIDPLLRDEFGRSRAEMQRVFKDNREEQHRIFKNLGESLSRTLSTFAATQKDQMTLFAQQLNNFANVFEERMAAMQQQFYAAAKEQREESTQALKSFEQTWSKNIKEFNELQQQQFRELHSRQEQVRKDIEERLQEIRATVDGNLKNIQQDNQKQLEAMRQTVDEKLQQTVEQRFSESFKLISERLEQVHKGLGEMQSLASGVGDLKKVLANVKTRGNLGEIQLGAILEQILSPEQYEQNAAVLPHSQERVEYVIKLPAKQSERQYVLLPIDAKFPIEDYQRLIEAYDHPAAGDLRELEVIARQFEQSIKRNARIIKEKYVHPPYTTDFAIMFVPSEGLYAEILRRRGLFENLQREYKITVVGPTNLVAFLSSLQMGFRTLAIEKRSSEVWELLSAVKTEFGNFGIILEKTKKKLQEATNVIERAGVRTRVIERKLKNVQELPVEQSIKLLGDLHDEEAESSPENTEEE